MRELPPGWAMATIADVTEYLSRGKQPKYADHSSLPVVNQRAIQWSGIQNEYLKYVAPTQFDRWEPERFIQPGDILWNSTGRGTVGRACLVTQKDIELPKVVDSHVTILRPNQQAIDPNFLFFWIRSSEIQDLIESLATGATNQIELGRKAIASVSIPVAPLDEQKRIIKKLDDLLARVDKCRARLNRVPQILEHFRQSVLAMAISGELTEGWRMEKSDSELKTDLLIKLKKEFGAESTKRKLDSQGGSRIDVSFPDNWLYVPVEAVGDVFLGRQRSPKNHSGPHMRPYLRSANITWDGWDLSDVKEMNFDPLDFERFKLKAGDVLVNEGSGSAGEVGKPAIWNEEVKDCCFQNTLICVRPFEDISEYLYFVFLNAALSKAFIKEARGISIQHLGKRRFAAFRIPIPPLEEQKEIVHRVKCLLAYSERLKASHQNALKKNEEMATTLINKAFRGDLVEQNSGEESAVALLDRMREEKTAKPRRIQSKRTPKMPKVTKKYVKEVISQLPRDTFLFNELQEQLPGEYDVLKDVIFALLDEPEPSISQIFDQERELMQFVRRDK